MRGVDDIVARLEGEGHARGVDAAGAAAVLGRARREVGDREHADTRRRDDDARGDWRVEEGHEAAAQGHHVTGGRGTRHGDGVLGGGSERLDEGDALVVEAKLERLAGGAVGHGEEHRGLVAHELADAPDELGVRAGDLRLDHLELGGRRLAGSHEGREGQALLGAEVQLVRRGVEALGPHASRARGRSDLVRGPLAVVEEGAWLGENHERLLGDVVDGRGRGAVELHEVALEHGSRGALVDELEVGGQLGALLRPVEEGALGMGDRLVGEGHLAAGRDRDLVQLADGLPGRGHHAADAVDLVAKELDAHRARGLRGEDVHGVTVDVEGARVGGLAHVRIPHAHEERGDLAKGDLVAHGEGARGVVARAHGRHAAQQGVSTRDHDALLASSETGDGAAARPDDGVIGRLV